MGMYDYIHCKYPLPIEGANELEYQTKDTDEQYLDHYEIREDGTLWLQINRDEWKQDLFCGEICFYTNHENGKWIEFSAYFVDGILKHLQVISDPLKESES